MLVKVVTPKTQAVKTRIAFGQYDTVASNSILKDGFEMKGSIELRRPVMAKIRQISSGPSTL